MSLKKSFKNPLSDSYRIRLVLTGRGLLPFLLFSLFCTAQTEEGVYLPSPVDWSVAGVKSWKESGKKLRMEDFGGLADGKTPNDEAIQKIVQDHPEGVEILLSKGEYLFEKRVKLPSNFSLKGVGINETVLLFDIEGEHDCILAEGRRTKEIVEVNESAHKGDSTLQIKKPLSLKKGDWVLLKSDDKHLVKSDWAVGKTGQIIQIRSVGANNIKLESQLRRGYPAKNSPELVKIDPVENVSVTALNIVRKTKSTRHTSNIQLRYAVNCAVHEIKSDSCNYAHVLLEYAANCEVKFSRFKSAHDYGDDGKAYGVVLQFASSECDVYDNEFEDLRHSILLQAGANGNRIWKNFSTNPYWTGVFLPKRAAGDIVLHGNYPYANLFERNTVQTVVIDGSHGINGPDNCFFENDILSYGIFMSLFPASDGQLFIKNRITGKGFLKGRYKIRGKNHIEGGNVVRGKIKPKDGETFFNASFAY